MTTIVVLQPGYLPWLGFFDQMLPMLSQILDALPK